MCLAVSVEGETGPGAGERILLDDLGDITHLRQGRYQIVDELAAMARRSRVDEQRLAEGLHAFISAPESLTTPASEGCLPRRCFFPLSISIPHRA